nr:secreted protein [Thraustotheca clavata]
MMRLTIVMLFMVLHVIAWEPMPEGYELIDGPHAHDNVSIGVWRDKWSNWKEMELKTYRYSPKDRASVYNTKALQWTQTSLLQVFVMMHDRMLFDRKTNQYTVDRFLSTFDLKFDSVLLWPSYPNLGIDTRNQWQLWHSLPGGIHGLKKLVDDFHARGVRVFLPYLPWDTATHDPNPLKSRYQSDIEELYKLFDATGADGVNGDTLFGVPSSFYRATEGKATCPEGGVPTWDLATNPMSWGYYYGFSSFPPVARAKFLEPRHMVQICSRWSLNRGLEFQISHFNGAGYVLWENIWGIWNGMTVREIETLKRTMMINQQFAFAIPSLQWTPHIPDLPKDLHASKFPVEISKLTFYTIICTNNQVYDGPMSLVLDEFLDASNVAVYDLYYGQKLQVVASGRSIQFSVHVEEYGYGALLVVAQGSEPEWLTTFLSTMHNQTKAPLASYDTQRPLLKQKMTSESSAAVVVSVDATSKAEPSNPKVIELLNLVEIAGVDAWNFTVDGVQIEPVPAWTPNGKDYGVGVQFPWEDRPYPHHATELWIEDFYIMKYPVTNAQYQTFLKASGYVPSDLHRFLLHWDHRHVNSTEYAPISSWIVPDSIANQPVVHVSLEDAQAFASYYGLRLPHDWEWQYVASNGLAYTKLPYGNDLDASRHPTIQRNGDSILSDDVDAFSSGCSTSNSICALIGHVWELTDSFCDTRTCSVLVRGGSSYQPVTSSLRDPNWYFPSIASTTKHGKFLTLSASYDRAATIGFRCAL